MCVVLVCTCGSVGHASDARLDEQRTEFKEGQMPDLIIRKAGGGAGLSAAGERSAMVLGGRRGWGETEGYSSVSSAILH